MVDGVLYAVADGMGGHRGGEVAAEMTAEGLETFARATPSPKTDALVNVISALNSSVLDRADQHDELYGMGTTLTGVATAMATTPSGGEELVLAVFNVGDSRTYLLRNGELQQLTEDHSVIADLIRTGQITPVQAKTHKQRSIVTRAIGAEADIDVDVIEVLPVPGMRYLLCSDGLTGEVTDQMIGSILRRLADPTEAARELVRLANEHGGRDNVSVVVVDVVDDAGFDREALAASQRIRPQPQSSAQARALTNSANDVTESWTAPKTAIERTSKPKRVRTPFPITPRVLFFIAIIAALGAAVFAVVKNSPATDTTIPSTELQVVSTTLATGTVPTEPSLTVATTIPEPTLAAVAATALATLAPEQATTTTIDDFAPPAPPTSPTRPPATKTRRLTKRTRPA
jgi:serine/threonine protein phosphatase PrpC